MSICNIDENQGFKTPEEVKDYTYDWRLDLEGDNIIAGGSAWSIEGSGSLQIDSTEISGANLFSSVWLSGGSQGETYIITNTIKTALGRTLTRTFVLYVVRYNPELSTL